MSALRSIRAKLDEIAVLLIEASRRKRRSRPFVLPTIQGGGVEIQWKL